MSLPGWRVAMVRSGAARSALTRTVAGLSVLDLATAAVLSLGAASLLASGIIHVSHSRGGLGASLGVLAMTAPVAIRRRFPLAAAGILAAGAVANGLAWGHLVRCAAALPAVFLVAYSVGARRDRGRATGGLALCAINVVAQAYWDPRLGVPVLGLMLPVLIAFFATGRVGRSREQAAQVLRQRSAELRRQRERTARMAVLAERGRVAASLDETLHVEIGRIRDDARAARRALNTDPGAAGRALAAIEQRGRDALRQMREVLGHLGDDAPAEPQPTLDQLPALLGRATTSTARLTVQGNRRALPASLELSGYRIVEHLLATFDDAPHSAIDVCLRFEQDALELLVSGPPARDADLAAAMAAASERAVLHGGSVHGSATEGRCVATARLPLISSHA
jgi:signal transduction histidine kinase